MKTYSEYITEKVTRVSKKPEEPTFVDKALQEDPKVAGEARAKGLKYLGFGMYGKSGYPTHFSHKGKLGTTEDYWLTPEDYIDNQYRKFSGHARKMNSFLTSNKMAPIFSRDEKRNLTQYTNNSHIFNKNLIHGKKLNAEQSEQDEAMQDAFDHNPAPTSYTVYTGVNHKISNNALKKGEHYLMKGYTSTSLHPKIATSFSSGKDGGGTVLQIHVPKGSRALHISKVSEWPHEKETLLDKNTKLKILSGPHHIGEHKFYKAIVVHPEEHHKFANDTMEEIK